MTAKAILGLDFLEVNKCILDLSGGKMQITNKTGPLFLQPSNKKVQGAKGTVTENLTIPPRSEMEVMAHIQCKGRGHMATRGYNVQKAINLCCKSLDSPEKPECANQNGQLM